MLSKFVRVLYYASTYLLLSKGIREIEFLKRAATITFLPQKRRNDNNNENKELGISLRLVTNDPTIIFKLDLK